ncbi:MAG TPA: tetratricopeptide repeat protein [Pyrinomonadaceae bacterium]
MIGETVSHYRILEKLGEGGMGIVYEAEDTHLGRHVAIKFLGEAAEGHHFRARFLREARAVSALSHAHIAAVYDYGETDDGQPFIVMEKIDGQLLSDLLQGSQLTIARAIEIIADVADALSEAHTRGIVHRDIKPSNVVINERGQVKVLDFGLAKQLHEEHTPAAADPNARTLLATRTRSDVIVGTPLYLSPEQAMGAEVDGRSDLFALGAMLYECVAGKPAFSGSSVIEIGAQVIHVDPPPPSVFNPRVPKELDRITMKALAKRPVERYQTAQEMLRDLHALRPALREDAHRTKRLAPTPQAAPSSALLSLAETLRRPRLSIFSVVIALAVGALLIWAVYHLIQPGPHEPTPEAKAAYQKGMSALRDGAYHQANLDFTRATKEDDKFIMAYARLAETQMELGYADRAKDDLLRVSSLVPDQSKLPQMDALYFNAISGVVLNDLARAITAYSAIAKLAPDQPQVYFDLGRAYERNEERDKALDNYREATRRDPQYALAILRTGALNGRNLNTPGAIASFDTAQALYDAQGLVEGQANVFYERGQLSISTGKLADAAAQLQRAYELASASGNESQKINAMLQLSRLAYIQGAPDKAQQYATDAISFAQQRGQDDLLARGLNGLGYALFVSGKYAEAEKNYNQAREFARLTKSQLREAEVLLNFAILYIQQLRTDEGLAYAREALAFFQQGGYRTNVGVCLTIIGRANRRKGDYEAALSAFQQNLAMAEQSGYQPQIAFANGEFGMVFTEQERYTDALNRYDISYSINKSLNDRLGLMYNELNRGNLQWRLGQYTEARASLQQAYERSNQPGATYQPVLAEVHLRWAQIALSERDFPKARAESEQAMTLADKQYEEVFVQAKLTRGLARTFSGAARDGRVDCEEAVEMAKHGDDSALLSQAMLALAEAQLEAGDARSALSTALTAQDRFAGAAQQESEWRAWLVAARAYRRQGDETAARDALARANEALSQLQQRWGAEAFMSYLTRPDIQLAHKQLGGSPVISAGT